MNRKRGRRRQKREPFGQMIDFTLSIADLTGPGSLNVKAMGVDVSDTGLGIVSEFPLEPGQVLRFHVEIRGHRVGVVEWTARCENGYRAGIRFK